jgi:putative transposase
MKRKAYLRLRERYVRRQKTFVYVDESGFESAVVRRYGRAPRGQKVYGLRPGNSRPRTCLLAAQIEGVVQATQLWEGTCDTRLFNHWLEHALCPILQDHHVVGMDNAAFHHSATTKELIEQAGAILLFLPPYSPDLNPIEQDFAAIKTIREFHEHETIDSIIKNYN